MVDRIRVLVVDHTATYRMVVRDVLSNDATIEVVGVAGNSTSALQMIETQRPDIVVLDLQLLVAEGPRVLKNLERLPNTPKVIILSEQPADGAKRTVDTLGLHALDCVLKPLVFSPEEAMAALQRTLLPLVKFNTGAKRSGVPAFRLTAPIVRAAATRSSSGSQLIVIGCSTGGPEALKRVLPLLPASLPVPVLVVQHMPPIFTRSLAESLNRHSPLSIREAENGEPLQAGSVLIAAGGYHMKVVRRGVGHVIAFSDDPPECNCRPAVDYLFRSVTETFPRTTIAVVMTGMGTDGTIGCRALHEAGSRIICQDEATSVVYGMPRGPVIEGTCDQVSPLDSIASDLVQMLGQQRAA